MVVMKRGKEDLGQGTGGGTVGLGQGARAGTEKVGNTGPLRRLDRVF